MSLSLPSDDVIHESPRQVTYRRGNRILQRVGGEEKTLGIIRGSTLTSWRSTWDADYRAWNCWGVDETLLRSGLFDRVAIKLSKHLEVATVMDFWNKGFLIDDETPRMVMARRYFTRVGGDG